MNERWTKESTTILRDQFAAGMSKQQLCELYGVQWQTLYKAMVKFDLYPMSLRIISAVKLKQLHAKFMDNPDLRTAELAATIGISKIALRARWRRMGLKSHTRKKQNRRRKLPWNKGYTIWLMRSKGKSTQDICTALNMQYDPKRSARFIRHHLLRWCYDTHTKVPSFELGTFRVKWLPPPAKPPT